MKKNFKYYLNKTVKIIKNMLLGFGVIFIILIALMIKDGEFNDNKSENIPHKDENTTISNEEIVTKEDKDKSIHVIEEDESIPVDVVASQSVLIAKALNVNNNKKSVDVADIADDTSELDLTNETNEESDAYKNVVGFIEDVKETKNMITNNRDYNKDDLDEFPISYLYNLKEANGRNFSEKYNLKMMIVTGKIDSIELSGNIILISKDEDWSYDEMYCETVKGIDVSNIYKGDTISVTGELSFDWLGRLKFMVYEIDEMQ
jgi:hypothetical protein